MLQFLWSSSVPSQDRNVLHATLAHASVRTSQGRHGLGQGHPRSHLQQRESANATRPSKSYTHRKTSLSD